eukprot:365933-Chlamydomonas_euryale.AAC.4
MAAQSALQRSPHAGAVRMLAHGSVLAWCGHAVSPLTGGWIWPWSHPTLPLCRLVRVIVIGTGSRPTKGMPVLSARQRGSSSGLGAITKGMPLYTVYQPKPANQDVRTGCKAAKVPSHHLEHELPTTRLSATSPSANHSRLTTASSGTLATFPRRVSHAAVRMCITWGNPAAAHV